MVESPLVSLATLQGTVLPLRSADTQPGKPF